MQKPSIDELRRIYDKDMNPQLAVALYLSYYANGGESVADMASKLKIRKEIVYRSSKSLISHGTAIKTDNKIVRLVEGVTPEDIVKAYTSYTIDELLQKE